MFSASATDARRAEEGILRGVVDGWEAAEAASAMPA